MTLDNPWCFLVSVRGSSASANNRGKRGQPWRVLLPMGKMWDIDPLTRTLAAGELYRSWTHSVKPEPNPNLSRTSKRYSHSTRSNALSASNGTNRSLLFVLCENCIVNNVNNPSKRIALLWYKLSLYFFHSAAGTSVVAIDNKIEQAMVSNAWTTSLSDHEPLLSCLL